MFRYSLAILLSAFLLFFIQPLVARKLLPELGGTATIWTTCVMFFQIALFIGYLYAHAIRVFLNPRSGWIVHCIFMAAAIATLVVQPEQIDEPATGELSWAVTQRLSYMIALPFIILSATSPLVQAWHSLSHPAQQTYRLYALSNAGSLIALLAYPFIFDPWIGLIMQSHIWTIGFCAFGIVMFACGMQLMGINDWPESGQPSASEARHAVKDSWSILFWIALAANGSVLLIATSNILCQEVASFPFLWLLPLICYLITMIVCFDSPKLYKRWLFQPAFAVCCFLAIVVYHFGTNIGLIGQTIGCCGVLFTGCMICHGEMVRLKPDVARLTQFYLAVALGGGLGGFLAVVVAPRWFNRFFEFHISLLMVALLSVLLFGVEHFKKRESSPRKMYLFLLASGFAVVPVISSLYYYLDPKLNRGVLFQGRNDYGLISVKQTDSYLMMQSGSTNHGGQFLADDMKRQPFAYYTNGSGAERAFSIIRKRQSGPLRVGVIGLGTGSLLNHSGTSDHFRFYEINPMVEQVAIEFFDYLPSENAEVVLGDGRIELQRELDQGKANRFDLLFLDAFSSDSIPVHLLTRECFELYLKHLKSNGIIVAHVTNKFVDLKPVLASHAKSSSLSSAYVAHRNDEFEIETDWILLSPDPNLIGKTDFDQQQLGWMIGLDEMAWTDDNSSVLPVVNWSKRSVK